ncbi:MAG: ribokinase [Clostridia bacterium]|nr:ribokinase [Clostridia bacterium]
MKKLLSFGSLNIDYTYRVNEFVSSGKTIKSLGLEKNIGGKGLNQSTAFAKAGGCVYHAGKIGTDGLFLKEYLDKVGVKTELINVGDTFSGHAIIQVDDAGGNCIIISGGSNMEITDEYVDEVLSNFESGDYLLLQNEINNLDYIVRKAHEKGMYIVLNPSPVEELDLPMELVDCFILNEHEAEAIFAASDIDDIIEAMKKQYPNAAFVLTLGAEGSVYIDKSSTIRANAVRTKAVDTTAAGDSFTGYFLNALINGESPKSALEIASKAAAITVSRVGAAESIPTFDEI